jgi:thiol:disulfide interchange protein DsbC
MRLSFLSKFVVSSLTICLLCTPAWADEGIDKKLCNSISPEEIQNMLVKINIKDTVFLYARESVLPGICEVAIERGGQPQIFFVNNTRTHMLLGTMIETKTMANLNAQAAQVIRSNKRIDVSKIPLDNALILGDSTAVKKIIVFTDPDCPFCGTLHEALKQITAKRKDIAFFIKLYPLEMHKEAYWKSKSIVCSKSLQMLEDNFNKKKIEKTECNTGEVDNNIQLAKSLGITGTPAIILPDGRFQTGTMPEEELTRLIDGKK